MASLRPNPNGTDKWAEGKTNTSCRMYRGLNSCGIDNLSLICISIFLRRPEVSHHDFRSFGGRPLFFFLSFYLTHRGNQSSGSLLPIMCGLCVWMHLSSLPHDVPAKNLYQFGGTDKDMFDWLIFLVIRVAFLVHVKVAFSVICHLSS
jgi:hypothetical protein